MLSEFLKDYLPIILFLIIALGLSCAFVLVNFVLSPKNPDPEKLSAYECGFEPFEDSRMEFDVRFYLVAILFIIFDLEIAFLFSLGCITWQHWDFRFYVDDDFFIYPYNWFHLRVEKRCVRLGIEYE